MHRKVLWVYIFSAIIVSHVSAQSPPAGNGNGLITTDGDNPLTTSFAWEGNGNAVVMAEAFDALPELSGTFILSGIPDSSTIIKSFYAVAGWQSTYTDVSGSFGGYNLDTIFPSNYDPDPNLYYLSFYRWDVTPMVTGNGSYSFWGSDLNYGYLAYLLVIYEENSLPLVRITVNDGAESLRNSFSITYFDSLTSGTGILKILTQAGDIVDEWGESIALNDSLLAGPDSVFNSNIGDHADYHEFALNDVQNSNSLTITTGNDWMGIHLAVFISAELPSNIYEIANESIDYCLTRNYPNPFTAATTIEYSFQQTSDVKIEIFDILGCNVETLMDFNMAPGYHRATWNATGFSSGVYFYKIQAGDYIDTKKMILLK